MRKPKIIFFTGGICSSVGKGLTLANLGRIFTELGFRVTAMKFDPYLNKNAGNLSPCQHGEVYVTKDGCEADLDLGHYERFMNCELSCDSCVTAGSIMKNILDRQETHEFTGETIQVVPHFVDEIHKKIMDLIEKNKDIDFLFIEIGGTVGDIESTPFLYAASRFKKKYGESDVLFIHISPLIYFPASKELKTKPTQHSIQQLISNLITPDLLILRSYIEPSEDIKVKISTTTNLALDEIFVCLDNNIYLIAEDLYEQNIHKQILKKLNIPVPDKNIDKWKDFTRNINSSKEKELRIALIAKYANLLDSYISITESFKIASYQLGANVKIECINVDDLKSMTLLSEYDAVCVPYGFGTRGAEQKTEAIRYCRENKIPFLGICFGMQLACIEYAKNVLNANWATSEELNPEMEEPMFIQLPDKKMRLGNKKIIIADGTLAKSLLGSKCIEARHRHRYHLNPKYIPLLETTDLVISGVSDCPQKIIEIVELKNHPFFVATQYHPEFETNFQHVCPFFTELIRAASKRTKDVRQQKI
ncbi:CTP synthase [Candidatus Mycoplasma haematohominis]|uniref:CTP synthase (glutamine hydrolyzing) n=1 Tax=Candidatus Mycoplasma haematohominis TaxID=1494318 RepID=A0A478FSH5_9MOLU|nr:CTP synthase [Candidatus Mycoplasma haemohominis]